MPRLWIIEDNDVYRRATAVGLRRAAAVGPGRRWAGGADVTEYATCEAALADLAAGPPPQVCLMDIDLPGMDGIEGIGEFKRRSPDVAVLVLTVFDDDDKVVRAIRAGAAGYCLKDDSIAEIRSAVAAVIDGDNPLHPRVAGTVLRQLRGTGASNGVVGARSDPAILTERELAVLRAMAGGLGRKQIARRLDLNPHTLDYTTRRIYQKLSVGGAAEAVAVAAAKGWLGT